MAPATTCKSTAKIANTSLPPSIDQIIAAVLSKSRYNGGSNLPMANEENIKLQQQLEQKQSYLLGLVQKKEDDILHITGIESHIARTQYAVVSSQNLITAKTGQIATESESHLHAKRILVKVTSALENTQQELWEIKSKLGKLLEYNHRRKQGIYASLTRCHLTAERLEELVRLTKARAADIESVTEYSQLDHQHLKKITAKAAALDASHRLLLQQLDTENANTLAERDVLSHLTKDFHENHEQRKDIIQMWEETIREVKRRDTQMTSLAQEYHQLRSLLQPLTERIDTALREETLTVASTKEAYFELEQIERKINQIRDTSQGMKQDTEILQEDASTARNDCHGLKQQISITSSAITAAVNKLYVTNKELAILQPTVQGLKADLEERMQEFDDSERNVERADNLINKLKAECEKVFEKISVWDNLRRERVAEVYFLEQEINATDSRTHTLQSQLEGITTTFNKDEYLHRKLSETVVNLALKIGQLNVRINGMTEVSVGDFKVQKDDIGPARETLAEVRELHHLITKQSQKNDLRMFKTTHEINSCLKAREDIETEIKLLRTAIISLEKSIEKASGEYNDYVVDINLKKVMLKRMQNMINDTRLGLFEIGQSRVEMEGAVRERKAEIETCMALNRSILKAESNNLQKLKGFIQDVQTSIHHKKLRFDKISRLMQISPEGAQAEHELRAFTEAFLKVMAEEETLKRALHDWEMKLKEGERELEGLRNAVSVVAICNQEFKQSLYPVSKKSTLYKTQVDEESEINSLFSRKHEAKKHCHGLLSQIQRALTSIKAVRYEIQLANLLREGRQETASQLSFDIVQQDTLLRHLCSITFKLLAEVKNCTSRQTLELLEVELKNVFLHEKLQFALVMLVKIIQQIPEVKDMIFSYLGAVQLLKKVQNLMQNGIHKLHSEKRFSFLQELYPQFLAYVADDKQWKSAIPTITRFLNFEKAMKNSEPFFKTKHKNHGRLNGS